MTVRRKETLEVKVPLLRGDPTESLRSSAAEQLDAKSGDKVRAHLLRIRSDLGEVSSKELNEQLKRPNVAVAWQFAVLGHDIEFSAVTLEVFPNGGMLNHHKIMLASVICVDSSGGGRFGA